LKLAICDSNLFARLARLSLIKIIPRVGGSATTA
jgi:hypothetical protein